MSCISASVALEGSLWTVMEDHRRKTQKIQCRLPRFCLLCTMEYPGNHTPLKGREV